MGRLHPEATPAGTGGLHGSGGVGGQLDGQLRKQHYVCGEGGWLHQGEVQASCPPASTPGHSAADLCPSRPAGLAATAPAASLLCVPH